jgi:tetratricopeptide (TPR) repeat protein
VKWSYVCNALAAVATPDARDALLKARDEKNEQKRRYAENALRSLRQRSPGYQYIYQGQHYAQQQEWKTAIAQYSLAIEIDPELPEAYAGRANAHLKLDEITEAHKDFSKASELDSQNSQAVTGLAVVLVLQGDYEAGIKAVEDARPRFPNDALYLYNAACVYGRAVEQVLKRADVKDRDVKLNAYREKAIGDLKQAVKQGFQDFTWLRKDPDLKSLHDLPEFQDLQSSATAEPANEKKR